MTSIRKVRPSIRREARAGTVGAEAGFTLIEAMISVVVLVFGLIAVTNLLLVAGTSNKVAGDTTAAANVAQQQLEALRVAPYRTVLAQAGAGPQTTQQDVPGVGVINVEWTVTSAAPAVPDGQLLHIRLAAESNNALARARSRAEYTLMRACTDFVTPDPDNPGHPYCPCSPALEPTCVP